MPQKHLFRFALENIPEREATAESGGTVRIRALSEELKRADDMLARYFPLHVVPVDYEERKQEGYGEYARDVLNQMGSNVYVKPGIATFTSNISLPGLLGKLPFVPAIYPFLHSKLEREIRKSGYEGILLPYEGCSEGGQFVVGDKFSLVSDIYDKRAMHRISKLTRKPVYPLHSFTCIGHAHIDGDYGVVDDARILYTSLQLGLVPTKPEFDDPLEIEMHNGFVNSRKTLDEIALEIGYELRGYCDGENNRLGINFITGDGGLFTIGIHPKEKDYVQSKGVKVVEIPLEHTTPGAGLRCVYGELVLR